MFTAWSEIKYLETKALVMSLILTTKQGHLLGNIFIPMLLTPLTVNSIFSLCWYFDEKCFRIQIVEEEDDLCAKCWLNLIGPKVVQTTKGGQIADDLALLDCHKKIHLK